MEVTPLTIPLEDPASTTPHHPMHMDPPLMPGAHAWWGPHQARAEGTMGPTGEMSPWGEGHTGGDIFTEEAGAGEVSLASGGEGEEDQEEGTTTWTVCWENPIHPDDLTWWVIIRAELTLHTTQDKFKTAPWCVMCVSV